MNMANVTQGPAGNTGDQLRKRLAAQGKRLPLLGNDADTANRQYTKYFALSRDRARGASHTLPWAEYFHKFTNAGQGHGSDLTLVQTKLDDTLVPGLFLRGSTSNIGVVRPRVRLSTSG